MCPVLLPLRFLRKKAETELTNKQTNKQNKTKQNRIVVPEENRNLLHYFDAALLPLSTGTILN